MSRQPLSISLNVKLGGDDVRKFEPAFLRKTLSYGRIDKIVRQLRHHYKENPASFDVPAFAVKVY